MEAVPLMVNNLRAGFTQITIDKYNEGTGTVRKPNQEIKVIKRVHASWPHADCQSSLDEYNFTPGSRIFKKFQLFKGLNVCWECEGDGPHHESPLKRRRAGRRFSSLDSAMASLQLDPAQKLRQVSEGPKFSLLSRLQAVRSVSAALKQENVPYNLSSCTLGQLDGTSDDRVDIENKDSLESPSGTSPFSEATADTPGEDSPALSNSDLSPKTPSTSPESGGHARKSLTGSCDLTLPNSSSFQDPFNFFNSEASTPLTRASPARGAFPFPAAERSPSSLTTFTSRSGASPIRSSQRFSSARPRSRSLTPSQRPDRFIPARNDSQTFKESLQITKSPEKLTPNQRVMRSNNSGPDPFSRHIPRTPPRTNIRRTGVTPVPSPATRGINNVLPVVSRASIAPTTRQVSNGAVWNVGGAAALGDTVAGVSDGRNGRLASGTNAPLYSSNFLFRTDLSSELDVHERRLALALDLNPSSRMLNFQGSSSLSPPSPAQLSPSCPTELGNRVWRNNEWVREGCVARWLSAYLSTVYDAHNMDRIKTQQKAQEGCANHSFQIFLDAPSLRDDFYCSLLAYSHTAKCLAVGLGSHVYLWAESHVDTPDSLRTPHTAHVSSLAFSSTQGGKAILGIGRADGRIMLWSPTEQEHRFDSLQPSPVCCVSFRPSTVKRPSIRDPYITVDTEELLIGDEVGNVYFYSVEWPNQDQRELFGWPGALTLVARITSHTQQICGLAWSPDGEWFATGGNDNTCHLYDTKRVLQIAGNHTAPSTESHHPLDLFNSGGSSRQTVDLSTRAYTIPSTVAKHKWTLLAAVKALAFCPWQRGLLAVGGGSNDRCIHFYHTISGACLATIDCSAQITSLIWSTTRREIAATFGFAQPDHPYRIAVFAWPSCEQIVAIPWYDEHRALYAIAYPGGPNVGRAGGEKRSNGEGGCWWSRTQEEGCLVVATSDCSIKFHEVWAEEKKATASKVGLLGGSDILEALHGIDKVGKVIR